MGGGGGGGGGGEVSCHTGIALSQSNGSKSEYAKLPKLVLKHFEENRVHGCHF